jgi:hypothetical protein
VKRVLGGGLLGISIKRVISWTPGWGVVLAAAFVALCAGCSFSEDKNEAEQFAEHYFAKVKSEDMEGILALYSPRFYEMTSRDKWKGILEDVRSRCGTPQSHSLVNWNVVNSFGSNSGTRTTLTYDVKYSSCRIAETMTVFKPSKGAIQIQGHFFRYEDREIEDGGKATESLKT